MVMTTEFPFDEKIQSFIIRHDGPWTVSVTPMIYNDRVILTHEDQYPDCYTAGYCYDKGGAAFLAAMVWNPITDHRPVGYKKIACEDNTRREALQ